MKRRFLPSSVLAASALFLTAAAAPAAVIFSDDFSSYTAVGSTADIQPGYMSEVYTVGGPLGLGLGATAGVNSSQGVTYASGDSNLVRKVGSVDLSQGAAVLELFFFFDDTGGGTANPQFGLVASGTGSFTSGADLSGRLTDSGGGIRLQLRANNSGGTAVTDTNNLPLVQNSWYMARFTATRLATADTFNLTLELYEASASGVVGSLVDSLSSNFVAANMYADTTLFGGLRINSSRITAFDNFSMSQIPEPGAGGLLLMAAAAAMMGIGHRARRRLSATREA